MESLTIYVYFNNSIKGEPQEGEREREREREIETERERKKETMRWRGTDKK